ncbi:MAG: hypothetical protein ABSD75_04775 [Terriglobales bacterium]|jgi:hypothetical protein
MKEMPSVSHQHAAGLEGAEQELVRIERDRILDPDRGHRALEAFAQGGKRAIGAVNVQPQPLFAAELRQRFDGVDRTRGHGAGAPHDAKRSEARVAIG